MFLLKLHHVQRCVSRSRRLSTAELMNHLTRRSEKPIKDGYMIWVFPKIGVPQNGRFIMENPIKMDDLEVPPF